MRYLSLIGLILCLVTSVGFAADMTLTATVRIDSMMLKGDIIDNLCAGSKNPAELGNFVKTHTKGCALMPACVKSGYSIFAEDKLYKFDAASNAEIAEFLRKPESKLQVVVMVKKNDGELSLVSIENQK